MAGLNRRSTLNLNNLVYGRTFAFINFIKSGDWTYSPDINLSLLDAQGYPTANSVVSGAGKLAYTEMSLAASANEPGPYVLTWTGVGEVIITSGTWTVNAGLSSGYVEVANGRYTGTNPYIVITLSAYTPTISSVVGMGILQSDPGAIGAYVRNLKFYLRADEADLNAGKVFRRAWKQGILDHNPGVIRALNWTGGSAGRQCRWTDRCPADYISFNHYYTGPNYPASTGTNDMVVSSATGMSSAMQHGEIAAFQITNSVVTAPGFRTITNITNASTGTVTCSTSHGFSNGQQVVIQIGQGMDSIHQLHFKVATVANASLASGSAFELSGINTSTFSSYATTSYFPGTVVSNYVSLNVGSRGAYPVLGDDAQPYGAFGVTISSCSYAGFIFDKTLVGNRDVGFGAWTIPQATINNSVFAPYYSGVPLEICVALVNELNEMKPAGSGPINLWITISPKAMMSVDPDYSSSNNIGTNSVTLCLNGSSNWAGLTPSAALLVEFSNETWNTAGGFTATSYLARAGQLHYGGATTPFTMSAQDTNSYSTIRSIVMFQDLSTTFASDITSGRLVRIMAGQGAYGMYPGSLSPNDQRTFGSSATLLDAWNTSSYPYNTFEAFAWASYFEPTSSWWVANGPTLISCYAANTGDPVAQEAICAEFVNNGIVPADEGITRYGSSVLPSFSHQMSSLNKTTLEYEGGYNWAVTGGSSNENAFLTGCYRSAAWAAQQKAFMNLFPPSTNAYHPAIYIQQGDRWSYTYPNIDTWSSGSEGGALNPTWYSVGEYNDSQDTTTASSGDTFPSFYVSQAVIFRGG